ncbi:hypothetical protein PERCYII40_3387 [Pseudomonas aeruginosa]|nr:hypothetical protein PERCYII40_3387 [Pseudomonas aeruginosa]
MSESRQNWTPPKSADTARIHAVPIRFDGRGGGARYPLVGVSCGAARPSLDYPARSNHPFAGAERHRVVRHGSCLGRPSTHL